MVRPRNALNPESQPWARSVERTVEELTGQTDRTSQYLKNAFRNINASLKRLGDQIVLLQDADAHQIRLESLQNETSGWSIPGGMGNGVIRATGSFIVPEGFSTAQIQVIVQVGGANTTGATDYVYAEAGSIDPLGIEASMRNPSNTVPSGEYGTSTAIHYYTYTGLSGGQSITVFSRPWTLTTTWPANTSNGDSLNANIIYTR